MKFVRFSGDDCFCVPVLSRRTLLFPLNSEHMLCPPLLKDYTRTAGLCFGRASLGVVADELALPRHPLLTIKENEFTGFMNFLTPFLQQK